MQRRKYNRESKVEVVGTGEQNDAQPVAEELNSGMQIVLTHKIFHFDLYSTDGYINILSGAVLPAGDNTSIAGWGPSFAGPADKPENLFPVSTPPTPGPITGPVYIWGFTDIDPDAMDIDPTGAHNNLMTVPAGAYAPAVGGPVGNAKFPAPFLEVTENSNVFVTLHNRGFYQNQQTVQDDHSLHWHGIHAQTPYDGFPESAGGYVERLRYFWEETWYKTLNDPVHHPANTTTTKQRDTWWNALSMAQQQNLLNANVGSAAVHENKLNPAGAVINKRNRSPITTDIQNFPFGVNNLTPSDTERVTQFTYYFSPMHSGTYMYHCHVSAAEHVQMGMYGALVVRPSDYIPSVKATWTVKGLGTNTEYDKEFTHILSEFDARWHKSIEGDPNYANYYPAQWRPDIWFVNGRTFPQNLLPFAWNRLSGSTIVAEPEPRYNTFIKVNPRERFLIRYIHMGYQSVPQHQHGWHMRIVSKDAMLVTPQREEYTLFMGSGETWDTITTADPVYGVTAPAGSPLSLIHPNSPSTNEPNGTLKWRVIYPVHNHNDYTVTTNGFYPGGAVVLIETCVPAASVPKLPPIGRTDPNAVFFKALHLGRPTWEDPYVDPAATTPPRSPPIPPGRGDIEEVATPAGCTGLPPH